MTSKLLLATVLIIATCGLVYELVAGALASYLLGDSITQFSTVIGVYLSAMGLGAHLSKYVERDLAGRFVDTELAVALIGGLSAPLLFLCFGRADVPMFRVVLYSLVLVVGTLVGLEIPLLLRILKDRYEFKDLIARVLAFDYLGALVASLMFPILLVPRLGLVRTSVAFGLLNAAVGIWSTYLLRGSLRGTSWLRVKGAGVMAILFAAFIAADQLTSLAEEGLYADEVVFAKTSPYQRMVITRNRAGFQLFLNGNLQFASADEYRYHEALVHPAMAMQPRPKRALVLGGGDGLAVRELLRYDELEQVVLVDLDPEMTKLARDNVLVRELNRDALHSPKVEIVNEDAYLWLERDHGLFDVVIIDFPDPNSFSLGKLYTTRFYNMLRRALSPGAAVAVQSTSPLMARSSYWCVVRTMEESGFHVRPYHAFVPSFGEWGFVLASDAPFEQPSKLRAQELSYLTDDLLPALFSFSADMGPVPVEVNRLNNQVLVQYYEAEWKRWN